MKCSIPLFLLLSIGSSNAQTSSQPECQPWTEAHLFDPNPMMKPAEDAYLASVVTEIEANCFDGATPIECDVSLSTDTAEAKAYETECYKWGGDLYTYDYSPLCGDISGSDQTSVKPVLVCSSASCEEIGVANLYPPAVLKELNNISCAAATNNLKEIEVDDPDSQPECYNWTQAHLFVPNADMKPAEDAYLAMVAEALGNTCISGGAVQDCSFTIERNAESDKYYEECGKMGGIMYSYDLMPSCDQDTEMKVEPVLICSSASCYEGGVANLYPQQAELYTAFDAIGVSCGSATNNLEEYTPPSGGGSSDDSVPSAAAAVKVMGAFWAMFVAVLV